MPLARSGCRISLTGSGCTSTPCGCHLDRLVSDRLVRHHVEERTQPGRPRLAFTAVHRPDAHDQRSYRLLAEILASFVTGTIPGAAAAATGAGRAWGHYLTERPAPYRRANEEESVTELLRILDDIGFAPERSHEEGSTEILLRHCPFLEVAEAHREVVCSVHLGLMQGVLAMRAPVTAERLQPFVTPMCVWRIWARPGADELGVDAEPPGLGSAGGRRNPNRSPACPERDLLDKLGHECPL